MIVVNMEHLSLNKMKKIKIVTKVLAVQQSRVKVKVTVIFLIKKNRKIIKIFQKREKINKVVKI